MAVLANIARLQVRTVLASRIHAIVAAEAASRDIRVVEYGR